MTKKGHSTRSMTLPLAVVAGVAGGLSPTISIAMRGQGPYAAFNELSRDFTGFDPASGTWDWRDLQKGLVPVFAGFFVHALASKFGVNRSLGRAKVPFIRI